MVKKDTDNHFYIYQIDFKDHSQLGFLSLVKIEDFIDKKIKAHEKIYENRMKERAEQMDNINTQIGPIYVSYPDNTTIDNILLSYIKSKPDYDFESFDNSIHKLWCIKDKEFHNSLIEEFKSIKNLYIADGHHRMGAMTIISKKYKSKKKNLENVMVAAFPAKQSKIYDYNRVIKDLNGLTENQFIEVISQNFDVKHQELPFKPNKKNQFGMYHEKKWYSLDFNKQSNEDNFLENLDINILNKYCLQSYLNISNSSVSGNSSGNNFGGGIYGRGTLSADYSSINDNTCESDGGGIYWQKGQVTIERSDIRRNHASRGGGVFILAENPIFQFNVIALNDATTIGGGMYIAKESSASSTPIILKSSEILKATTTGSDIHIIVSVLEMT